MTSTLFDAIHWLRDVGAKGRVGEAGIKVVVTLDLGFTFCAAAR
jgi:hypothetical protein